MKIYGEGVANKSKSGQILDVYFPNIEFANKKTDAKNIDVLSDSQELIKIDWSEVDLKNPIEIEINNTLKRYKDKAFDNTVSRLIRYKKLVNNERCITNKMAFFILVTINDIQTMYSKVLTQANKFGLKNEFNNFVKSTMKIFKIICV